MATKIPIQPFTIHPGKEGKEGWNKIREQGRGREKSEASKGGVGTCRREERKGEQVRRRGSKAYIRKRREKGTAKSNYRKEAHSKDIMDRNRYVGLRDTNTPATHSDS